MVAAATAAVMAVVAMAEEVKAVAMEAAARVAAMAAATVRWLMVEAMAVATAVMKTAVAMAAAVMAAAYHSWYITPRFVSITVAGSGCWSFGRGSPLDRIVAGERIEIASGSAVVCRLGGRPRLSSPRRQAPVAGSSSCTAPMSRRFEAS